MLKELGRIHTGSTPKTNDESLFGGDVPFVTPGDLDAVSSIQSTPRTLTDAGVKTAELLPAESVLVCCIGSLGKIGFAGRPVVTNQQINAVVFNPAKVHARYGFFACRMLKPQLELMAPATTVPIVNKSRFSELRIPVPPLEDQRRIAAILDQAETLRTQRRQALAHLDTLTQSLFLDMFGDPVANDRGWPMAAVSDFVAGFESGKSLVADDEDDSTSVFRVLKVSAVTSLEYKPEQSKAVPSDYVPPKSHIVRAGDLLFSRANTTELIGATAFVAATPDNLLLPDKLWRFVWHQPTRTAPLYVRHLFQQPKFRQEIGQRASGTSGSMKNISHEKVLSIRVGNPPLPLQQTFATRIAAIEALKATHRTALAQLDALFASLQQRAFAGDL